MKRIPLTPVGRAFKGTPVGGIFYARPKEARILILARKARPADDVVIVEAATPPLAESPPAVPDVEISPRTGKPKRAYRRRDMVAED